MKGQDKYIPQEVQYDTMTVENTSRSWLTSVFHFNQWQNSCCHALIQFSSLQSALRKGGGEGSSSYVDKVLKHGCRKII